MKDTETKKGVGAEEAEGKRSGGGEEWNKKNNNINDSAKQKKNRHHKKNSVKDGTKSRNRSAPNNDKQNDPNGDPEIEQCVSARSNINSSTKTETTITSGKNTNNGGGRRNGKPKKSGSSNNNSTSQRKKDQKRRNDRRLKTSSNGVNNNDESDVHNSKESNCYDATGNTNIDMNSNTNTHPSNTYHKNGHNNSRKQNGRRNHQRKNSGRNIQYPDYTPLNECLRLYAKRDKNLIRGKLRVMPGGAMAFVSCDRGSYNRDVVIEGEMMRNRALDGDNIYVQITGSVTELSAGNTNEVEQKRSPTNASNNHNDDSEIDENHITEEFNSNLRIENQTDDIDDDDDDDDGDYTREEREDDEVQRSLWDPAVRIHKKKNTKNGDDKVEDEEQFLGKVICIIPPKSSSLPGYQPSEINPSEEIYRNRIARTIVGTLMSMPGNNNNRYLFVPNSRSLPRFMTPASTKGKMTAIHGDDEIAIQKQLCCAEYTYGSWSNTDKWPPCTNLKVMGQSCNVEDETMALLIDNGVDHGEFSPQVLKDVEEAVASGRIHCQQQDNDLGWEPTPEMLRGRRDYRNERIFTIDPTTAKDLDDALHIKSLPDGRVEIGVHIADVSAFVTPDTHVDNEAERRSTTVYLVDRTVPMLPRPLCEIACSLNENVERLAFSCVWKMNKDGTLAKKKSRGREYSNDVWYGRTVIKSCSRLDYATAQNIIDRKVACGEKASEIDEKMWPKSRQPTGGHSVDDVAADVRLMHTVAMARRKLRFENGALALNGVKLAFQLESDGQTPALCAPYPIRDSNRLIEEYMLLANYLVAQRLITHAGGLALLRQHQPPINQGLKNVIDIAQETGHHIDGTNSKTLQQSLSQMGRECNDQLVMQCVTEMLMTPMRPAEYIAAGGFDSDEWHHFALNIPYYTHFTSPIRRYPDIIVHRLLQATLDGQETVSNFYQGESEIQSICEHCNDKRMASKKAQDRSDRVFLSLYLKANPIDSTLGVVVSIGEKAFTVFVPKLGLTTMVYLDEHKDKYNVNVQKNDSGQRRMILIPLNKSIGQRLDIKLFTKIAVSCNCKEKPPIDVSLSIVGHWANQD